MQEYFVNSPFVSADEAQELGLDKLISKLINLTCDSSLAGQMKIQAVLLTIFSILQERSDIEKNNTYNPIVPKSSFSAAIEEARKNMYTITTADAARLSGLSYNYFCSAFKKAYGISFSAYLDSLRLSESTRLLLTTDMSITEIAAELGFSDTCHYIRKFKAAYGITPHKYRDKRRS